MASWEVLICDRQAHRPRIARPLRRLCEVTGGKVAQDRYAGKADILLLWGFGGEKQQAAFNAHRKSGRHVVCIDLGYWDRGEGGIRFAVDSWHPQAIDFAQTNKPRPGYEVPPLDDTYYDPQGHIVIAGLGKKSRRLLGFDGMAWEEKQVAITRAAHPGKRIIYRPKPNHDETIQGAENGVAGAIEDYLRGASMAVCLHSNVALDCARLGIPCFAYDGIGAQGFGLGTIDKPLRLTGLARAGFLNGAAWFNWQPVGFGRMVEFIYELIEVRDAAGK